MLYKKSLKVSVKSKINSLAAYIKVALPQYAENTPRPKKKPFNKQLKTYAEDSVNNKRKYKSTAVF